MPAALVRHSRRKMRSKVESKQRERFAKIGDYVMEWLGHLGIARSDADKQTDAGRSAAFDVAYLIAEDRAASGIEPEIGDGLQQHSRLGFAPRVIATVFTDAILKGDKGNDRPGRLRCPPLRSDRTSIASSPHRRVRRNSRGRCRIDSSRQRSAAAARWSRNEPNRKSRERTRIAPTDECSHGP